MLCCGKRVFTCFEPLRFTSNTDRSATFATTMYTTNTSTPTHANIPIMPVTAFPTSRKRLLAERPRHKPHHPRHHVRLHVRRRHADLKHQLHAKCKPPSAHRPAGGTAPLPPPRPARRPPLRRRTTASTASQAQAATGMPSNATSRTTRATRTSCATSAAAVR